jgi:hypothetical protein
MMYFGRFKVVSDQSGKFFDISETFWLFESLTQKTKLLRRKSLRIIIILFSGRRENMEILITIIFVISYLFNFFFDQLHNLF